MSRRGRDRFAVAGLALVLVLVGLGPPGPAAAKEDAGGPASTIESDYRTDPYLSAEQKQLLDRLGERSPTGVAAQSWPHGGTVARLELTVPSGLPKEQPLAEHALAFLTGNSSLWNVTERTGLEVISTVAAGDCSAVTVGRTTGELPVFNAAVTVVLTPEGTVRGVAGRLDGSPLGEVARPATSAKQATAAVRAFVEERADEPPDGLVLPAPAQVVVDPYFLADQAHQPGAGWLLAEQPGGTGPGGAVVVNGQTGAVVAAGPGVVLPNRSVTVCPGVDPTKVYFPYVLDPMTDTPALLNFGRLGIPTVGTTPVERAYHLLDQPFMLDMYGDRAPRRHLRDPEVIAGVGGRTTVRFTEYYGDLPVEGARLSVSLLPNGNAALVTARFVYFPHARTTAAVPEADAVAAATGRYLDLECGTDQACRSALAVQVQASPPATSLTILSAEIFAGTQIPPLPAGQERLTYKIEFPGWVSFWDATDNAERYGYPTVSQAIPHIIKNAEQGGRTEIVGGVPVAGVTPHRDATRVSAWLSAFDVFLLGLGRNGVDGNGGLVTVQVRDSIDNAYWCDPRNLEPCGGNRLSLGVDYTAADITGHELSHGIIRATADFARGGEPGALSEHYADVMGNLAFPDSDPNQWLVGENSNAGVLRDMADPAAFDQPGHYGLLRDFCTDLIFCSHRWAGVPNRAAVLIADGGVPGSSHPGVGRPTLARLYLDTLTSGRSGSSDLFLHQRVNTIATCEEMLADSAVVAGRPVVPADCTHVARAFATVGVDAPYQMGWTRFGSDASRDWWTEVPIREGLELYRGCTIANQILRGMDRWTGETRESDVADGLEINFSDEWGARVVFRRAATEPTQRMLMYRIWSDWYQAGVVDVHEVFAKPAGVTDEQCTVPPGPVPVHRRTLYSADRISHWAVFLFGARGDDPINTNLWLPRGCRIDSVRGIHFHDWGQPPEGSPATWVDHGGHGFRVRRADLSQRRLDAVVHWWHSGFSSIKVLVQYDLFEEQGTDCLRRGLQEYP